MLEVKKVNRIGAGSVVAESVSDNRFPGTIGIAALKFCSKTCVAMKFVDDDDDDDDDDDEGK